MDDEERILSYAASILELLGRDMDEDDRAREVLREHRYLNTQQELYLSVWRILDAGKRSAWKSLREKGEAMKRGALMLPNGRSP